MGRHEFMEQLKRRLHKLPVDEVKEALEYYEQYFDDAGVENEKDVIAGLGSPSKVASQIIADFAVKGADAEKKSTKRGVSAIWLVILAIFASPIALPLALAAVIIAFAIFVAIFAIVLSIGITGIALLAAGVLCAILGIPLFIHSFAASLFCVGVGLTLFGVGLLLTAGAMVLSKEAFGWLAGCMGRFVLRRNEK